MSACVPLQRMISSGWNVSGRATRSRCGGISGNDGNSMVTLLSVQSLSILAKKSALKSHMSFFFVWHI